MLDTTAQKISELAKTVATMLESGDTSAWTKPWKSTGSIPTNALTKAPYHGLNRLSLWITAALENYKTHYWMTFKQKQKLGEQLERDITVRKGETGTICFRWVNWIPRQYKKIGADEYLNTRTGEICSEQHATQFALKTFKVFNIDQMENIPDDYYYATKKAMTYVIQQQACQDFVDNTGAVIQKGGDRACFIPSHDIIQMPHAADFLTEEDYWSTLFHELTHWTGHKDRLKRASLIERSDESYAAEELVAEFGAAFLCAEFDIEEPEPRHAQYLTHWARQLREQPDILLTTSRNAEKAADYLQNLNARSASIHTVKEESQ